MSTQTSPRASKRTKPWRSWRRKLLTQELVDELAGYFRQGATVKIAAGRIGVPAGVVRGWLREGEKQLEAIYAADAGYPELEGLLYHDCAKATAEWLAAKVDAVNEPGDADWRASSWLLERRDEDFNPASKVEVTGVEGGPILYEGKAVVGWADLIALAERTGQSHLIGLPGGGGQDALPVAREVLPDPAELERSADAPPGVLGT